MIKTQATEAPIWLKYTFHIDKVAVKWKKKIPSFTKIIQDISHGGKPARKRVLPVFIK